MTPDFEEHRTALFAIAYRMLGAASDAEDVLQDAFLRLLAEAGEIRSTRAWLTTTVTRLCLDKLKSARAQRETYVGDWLPEPLPTGTLEVPELPSERVDVAESISMAFLLVLERLSPLERATFLLREVFDHEWAEVAAILNKSEPACRQLFHRAKEHVEAGRPRYQSAPEERRALTMAFLGACVGGDVALLMKLLAPGVTAASDSGGQVRAARRTIVGPDHVARFLVGVTRKAPIGLVPELMVLNGEAAIVVRDAAHVHAAMVLEVHAGQIVTVRIVMNPEKLRAMNAAVLR